MANKLISEMGLPKSIGHIFAARNIITAKDALSLTEFELMELLDVSLPQVTLAVALISEIASPPYQTVRSMLEHRMQNEYLTGHLPTHLKGLDAALCGGIPFGGLTELVGPAGIGKTQFCLKIALLATLPSCYGGLDGHVIYIDVESKFSSRRLIEIGINSFPDIFRLDGMAKEMAGRITVLRPGSLSEFTESLQKIKVSLIQHQVKLLVVDSMAALVSGSLAEFSRIPVVMTNQVRSRSATEISQYSFQDNRADATTDDSGSFDSHLVAALGIHWAHAVTIRLVLESRSGTRFIKVAKSPMSPPLAFPFKVTSMGIVLLNDDGIEMNGPQINAIDHQEVKGEDYAFMFLAKTLEVDYCEFLSLPNFRTLKPKPPKLEQYFLPSMAVAEIFIGAFITVLFEKLASADLIRLARSAGIYSELDKWNNTLSQIQAVLVDAGQKHLRQRSIQLWLHKLQHLAYDIDDVLDDLATEAMRRQLNEETYATTNTSTRKVQKIIPTCCTNFTPRTIKYGHKMSSKLDEITTKLHHLVEEKNILGLISNVERGNRSSRRLEETSLVDESRIVGREGDKRELLEKLLGNESGNENVSILSIVGLGGIGKTTLAQVLYNEKKVKDQFELMAWVCVSDEFEVFNISKAIFQAVGGGNQDFANLDLLQVALTEKLSKRRFLLVLDDVWNENYKEWELLQRPFAVGAPGSKVIVTTRKTSVASVMDFVHVYPLELLSNEEALSLFAQHALGKQNFDSHPTLKLHGEGIMKKCGGLPLALITLGRVLRTKTNEEEWEELLNSEIWNLHNESKILPALRLSYYDLPPRLKQMFAYCSLFPKDYLFDKDELVLLWMAEGFLLESNGSKSMESLGRDCFQELESRSFFQYSTNNTSRYIMHDLIIDLATSVAGEFFFMLDDKIDVYEGLEKLHHLSYIHQRYGVYRKFKAFQRAKRLRTFLALSVKFLKSWQRSSLSNKVLIELLPQLKFLRVLSLANYSIKEIPESIGGLKHLRYLNFSKTYISCLPEQVGDLSNLQSLLVNGCHLLSSLPDSCVKLINLRHLDISDTPQLTKIPVRIGELTSLQTLSKIIIGGSNEFKISELKGLLHLQGQLSIKGLHKVMNVTHAKEANLQQKRGLCDLEMEWSDVFDDSRNENTEYEVLDGLRPYEKLKSLKIINYMGMKFPSWVGDPSFIFLTQLTLRGCKSCTYLPTLGHLQSLQKLCIESMGGLKRLDYEFLGPNIPFPSLEVLEFKDLQNWESWSTNGGGHKGSFPCLRDISIVNCPNLVKVAVDLIPSLQVLHLEECCVSVLRSMVGVSSSVLELSVMNIKGLTQLHGEVLNHLRSVEHLCITGCEELRYLWESESEACKILVSLWDLRVKFCKNLVSLGKKEVNLDTNSWIFLKSIRKVELHNCPKLKSYSCPNGIQNLDIYGCRPITSLNFPPLHNLPSTLKILSICYFDNLDANCLQNHFLSSLKYLSITRVPNLSSFPEKCLVHLTKLIIRGCDNIKSIPDNGFGFLPLFCLKYLEINSCKNLNSFPHNHLQSLTSLEELWITDCPNMNYTFPCNSWPPNLTTLTIGGLKRPISEWGPQNFPTSLVKLCLYGKISGVVPFGKMEDVINGSNTTPLAFVVPVSLTLLQIHGFMDLESVSEGLQHLTCLEELIIWSCPKLKDLPEMVLPKLSRLWVDSSSLELRKKCGGRKGKYWPIVSQIPDLDVD
ncbi:hypothetical protein LXL04_000481 [Taraxacum kok-saghyz]